MTRTDWLSKLKTFVPDWFVSEGPRATAILDGLAQQMADHDLEVGYLMRQLFIGSAEGAFLDLWGHDRGVERNTGESDDVYRVRVQSQNLISKASLPDLRAIVNSLLIRGTAQLTEDNLGGFFLSRNTFISRGAVLFPVIKDAFTILIDRQLHQPYSFASRKQFLGRESFAGTNEASLSVLQNVIQALNDNRAFGALYRIVERLN